jgi:hypothetical protein
LGEWLQNKNRNVVIFAMKVEIMYCYCGSLLDKILILKEEKFFYHEIFTFPAAVFLSE